MTSNAEQDLPVAKCWVDRNSTTAWVVVEFKNVGRGTAFLGDVLTTTAIEMNGNDELYGEPYSLSIPADDRPIITFAGQPNLSAPANSLHTYVTVGYSFTVSLRYSDLGRRRWYETRVVFGSDRPLPEVMEVEIMEGGSATSSTELRPTQS